MTIQVNSDNNITGTEGLSSFVETTIAEALKRFNSYITRVEVHLTDENGNKSGINDKRCLLEARLEGMQPIAVTAHGDTIQAALRDALIKLKSSLDSTLGRLQNH
jgi:ribosome-associated translation inhibitor RaiA